MCKRAAKIWGVPEEGVVFEDGYCRPASSNVGDFEPLSIADIARQAGATGGAIAGHAEMNVTGAGPGFGVHIVDVEVDKETGGVKVVRYTVVEDAGKAIHPLQVEGQCQGGAVQGIGWALNEEYIYGEDGRLQNPSFLDYRIPVASDVPMIDPVIVEVPNPKHPFGAARRRRGAGDTDAGRHRQCRHRRHRRPPVRAADVAATALEADRAGAAGKGRLATNFSIEEIGASDQYFDHARCESVGESLVEIFSKAGRGSQQPVRTPSVVTTIAQALPVLPWRQDTTARLRAYAPHNIYFPTFSSSKF